MNKSKLNELLRYAWLEGRTNGLQNNGKTFSEFLELKEVSEAINYTHSCKSDSEQLVCDDNELDCPFDFTSRCTIGRCNCKPKAN